MRSEISASDRGEKDFRHLVGSVIEGERVGKVGLGNQLLMSATFSSKKEEKLSAVRGEGGLRMEEKVEKSLWEFEAELILFRK